MNYFGLIRAAAGWPSSMSFLPVSTRSLPSIRRIEKFLSRKLPTLDVFAVRREGDRFRQAADLELLHLRHFVSVDAQENRRSVLVVEERFLAGVRAAQQGGGGKIAARTDGEAFGPVADHNLVEDARRIGRHIDDANRVDIVIRGSGAPIVRRHRELTVRREVDIVRPKAGCDVVLL